MYRLQLVIITALLAISLGVHIITSFSHKLDLEAIEKAMNKNYCVMMRGELAPTKTRGKK